MSEKIDVRRTPHEASHGAPPRDASTVRDTPVGSALRSGRRIATIAALLAIGSSVVSVPALAATTPLRGAFVVTETRTPDPHCGGLRIQSTGSGTVTRLGAVTWSATECADFAAFPGRIHVRDGRAVLTSANGDELHVSFEADGALPNLAGDVHVSGPLTITGGTGRFRDASGGGTLTADPNISATTSRCRSTPPSRCER